MCAGNLFCTDIIVSQKKRHLIKIYVALAVCRCIYGNSGDMAGISDKNYTGNRNRKQYEWVVHIGDRFHNCNLNGTYFYCVKTKR